MRPDRITYIRREAVMKVVNVKNVAIGEGMTKICVPLVAPTDYDVDYQSRIIAKSEPEVF